MEKLIPSGWVVSTSLGASSLLPQGWHEAPATSRGWELLSSWGWFFFFDS